MTISIKEAIETGRAWSVRPGNRDEHWEDWKKRSVVSVGFYPIDLGNFYDSSKKDEKGRAVYKGGKEKAKTKGLNKIIDKFLPTSGTENQNWYKPGKSREGKRDKTEIELHSFASFRKGDLIFAHNTVRLNPKTVLLGIGEVTGEYKFDKTGHTNANGDKHHHSYKVNWFNTKGISASLPEGSGFKHGGTTNSVKKKDLSWLIGKKINHWMFIVDDPNWEKVKELNIWDSKAKLDTLNKKIFPGDKAIFYVTGRKSFKNSENAKHFCGSFEITSKWINKTGSPSPWPGPEKFPVSNRITLKPIVIGKAPLSILEKSSIYKKELGDINREKISKKAKEGKRQRIMGRLTQQTAKIAGNNATPLPKSDYDLIVNEMKKNGTSSSSGIVKLVEETSIKESIITEIAEELEEQKQIILVGPPGTSKTYFAQKFAKWFTGDGDVEIVQFHPSYNYEDFVEGIRPKIEKGKINQFEVARGILKRIVDFKCVDGKKHVLIIDEINRGNIARIFGELIYLLEYREKEIRLTYSPKEKFKLPSNLYIIGTMNTADRSIGSVDYALRRRFTWFEFSADKEILEKFLMKNGTTSKQTKQICDLMEQVNAEIEDSVVGKDCQIGQTYFMKKDMTEEKMKKIFNRKILPLLKEYYFTDKTKIETITELFEKFKLSS